MRIMTPPRPGFSTFPGTMLNVNLQTLMAAACLVFTAFGTSSLAAEESTSPAAYKHTLQGSAPTARQTTDGYSGSVYIYTGGAFPIYTYPIAFQYLFGLSGAGNTTGYITPLLFEPQAVGQYTVYIVRGIGKGSEVSLNPAPQTIPFEILEGTKITTSGQFTFGFINALVDSHGTPLAVSQGAVEYVNPAVSGSGEGGPATTNNWAASSTQDTNVALGATFGVSGSNAANNLFTGYRTYSALAVGVVLAQ